VRFHPLSVVQVERAAEDAVCVSLRVPAELRAEFDFHAGQYLTVRRPIEGRNEQRTYSIVSPPGSVLLKIGVRAQHGGRMSQELAHRVRPGDVLEVGTPLGRFRTSVDAARVRSYVALAAGSGITPVLSLATHILEREPGSRFLLIYGNRTTASTMFLEETLALKNRFLGRFSVYFIMSREPQDAALMNGRIDREKIEALAVRIPDLARADEYFLCGPAGMVESVKPALAAMNPDAPVRIERFGAATAVGVVAPPARAAADADFAPSAPPVSAPSAPRAAPEPSLPLARIEILMDGRRRSFTMAADDESVLVAAERAGLHLPFSCRSGICATCRARITQGAAVMRHNIALEPWEVETGFVLCCQARPTTPTLDLSYDEK
jgi:ring-1,2-phenylacetyl-CoA epoxidase subunit PaaE